MASSSSWLLMLVSLCAFGVPVTAVRKTFDTETVELNQTTEVGEDMCYCKSHASQAAKGLYKKSQWGVKGPGGNKCSSSTPCTDCSRHGDACCMVTSSGGVGKCGKFISAGSLDFKNAKCACPGIKHKSALARKNPDCVPSMSCAQCDRNCWDINSGGSSSPSPRRRAASSPRRRSAPADSSPRRRVGPDRRRRTGAADFSAPGGNARRRTSSGGSAPAPAPRRRVAPTKAPWKNAQADVRRREPEKKEFIHRRRDPKTAKGGKDEKDPNARRRNVADSIEKSKCDRSTRYFSSSTVVDGTMSCTNLYIGKKSCGCANKKWCYVSSKNRPPPKNIKRCFTPEDDDDDDDDDEHDD